MNLRNDFHSDDRSYYAFEHSCVECDSNQGVELHHILGRGGKYNDSILNSSMICRKCHENYTFLSKSKLLQQTLRFLLKSDYKLKERDVLFYRENIIYYE
jgi:hypothetical protein